MKKILERQLRDIIRAIISEGADDIKDVFVKVRAKTYGPSSPTVSDIITDIRGIPNVVTVIQEKPLTDEPEGMVMLYLQIRFNHLKVNDIDNLKKDLKAINGIEMVILNDSRNKTAISID